MEEVENKSVPNEEIAAPETQPVQEIQVEAAVKTEESDKQERNWKELRRAKDELEKKSRMQDEIIQKLMSQSLQQTPAQFQPQEEDIDALLQQEEYPSGDKVVKALKKTRAEIARDLQQLREEQAKLHRTARLSDLKRKYSDFDDVVTPENLAIIEETDPDSAEIMAKTKDPYDIAVLSYKWIKAHNIVEKTSGNKRAKEIDEKLEQNKKTVQTPQAFEKRPMAQAFKAPDKEEQKRLFAEMHHYANQSGGGY